MGDSPSSRPEPTANGTLAKTPFVHLIVYALEKKLSGSMELFTPDKRSATVLFAEGLPVKVRTSDAVAHLGRVLQEMGFLSEEQLSRSLADLAKEKASGKRLHGQVLLSSGMIDAGKLRTGLVEQIGRKLGHVAAMPPTTVYAYFDGYDALRGWGGPETEGVDPFPFLRGMLREHVAVEPMKAALAKAAASALRPSRDSDFTRLRLVKDEAQAIELLRIRPLGVSELARTGQLDESRAEQLVYLLMLTKQVDFVQPAESSPPPPRARSSRPPTAPSSRTLTTAPVASGTMPTGRVSVPPATKITPPPPGLTPELKERWDEIATRAATIDRADYFMMLDLARDASIEQVQSAFFTLAKKWHPDRLPPELAPIRDACNRVFARMSEAHSTLGDEQQRGRYMRLLAEGSGSPEMQESVQKVLDAARDFQKAEICFKRNDLAQAETFCRQALEADATQPDYHAMLAWLIALKPDNQSEAKTLECIRMLDRAVKMSDMCEKGFFWRAMLYKRLGRGELAAKDFRRVTDLNPRNIDAAREVRLNTMRGGSRPSTPPPATRSSSSSNPSNSKPDESAPSKGGLFGRLFKKP